MKTHANTHACPICRSSGRRQLLDWGVYHINLCIECGLLFAAPLPSEAELADFYQGFLFRKPPRGQIVRQVRSKKKELIRRFGADRMRHGRFLDVGGGTGVATRAASELGMDAYLQDIDEEATAFACEEVGIVPSRIVSKLQDIPGRFDAILADNVIEHVPDPVALVEQMFALLVPGGTLVVKTPNARNTETWFFPRIVVSGYIRRAYGYGNPCRVVLGACWTRWWHCDPPRHLWGFSRGSLEQLVAGLSLPSAQFDYYRIGLWEYSAASRWAALFRLLGKEVAVRTAFAEMLGRHGFSRWKRRIGDLFWLPMELPLKGCQATLRLMRCTSPGGIVMTLNRPTTSVQIEARK